MTERAGSEPALALVANDQEWSARSIESVLTPRGFAVIRTSTSQETLDQVRAQHPDVILLDVGLPDLSGIDTCRILRSDPTVSPSTPIILTTARPASRRERLEALAAGAWDFKPLPLDAEELLLQLDTYVAAKLATDRANQRSLIDPVTELYNLRGVLRHLGQLLALTKREERPLACFMLAPEVGVPEDAPKTQRRAARGMVMEAMAAVLGTEIRASDTAGRVRSAEFAVVAPATPARGAHALARRLHGAIGDAAQRERIGVSAVIKIGYDVHVEPSEVAVTPEALLSRASAALRSAQAAPNGGPIRRADAGNGSS